MCLEDLDLDYLADSKHFHFSSFFLHRALRSRIPELFARMKQKGLTTSLDTNDDPDGPLGDDLFEVLKHVDVFFANEREAKKIAHAGDVEAAMAALAPRVPILVVKLGGEGAMARGPSGTGPMPGAGRRGGRPGGSGRQF